MADYPLVALGSLARFADAAGVSGPTILRLIGKLGYSGYPEFRAQLHEELASRLSTPLDHPEAEAGEDDSILMRSYRQFVVAARETWSGIKIEDIAAAVELLVDPARPVVIVGGTFTAEIAKHMVTYLGLLRGEVAEVPPEDRSRRVALLDCGDRTTVVAFDYRQYQPETVAFAHQARSRGARIVLICDRPLSPIASSADVVLPVSTEGLPPFDSLIGGYMVTDTLVSAAAERLGAAARSRLSTFLHYGDLAEALTQQDSVGRGRGAP